MLLSKASPLIPSMGGPVGNMSMKQRTNVGQMLDYLEEVDVAIKLICVYIYN